MRNYVPRISKENFKGKKKRGCMREFTCFKCGIGGHFAKDCKINNN